VARAGDDDALLDALVGVASRASRWHGSPAASPSATSSSASIPASTCPLAHRAAGAPRRGACWRRTGPRSICVRGPGPSPDPGRRPPARGGGDGLGRRAVTCARANGVEAYCGDLFAPLPGALDGGRPGRRRGAVCADLALALLQRDTLTFESPLSYDGGPDGTTSSARPDREPPLPPPGARPLELGGEEADALSGDLSGWATSTSPSCSTLTTTSAGSRRPGRRDGATTGGLPTCQAGQGDQHDGGHQAHRLDVDEAQQASATYHGQPGHGPQGQQAPRPTEKGEW